jgi:hypothetical protein|tara:strand:+ start:77 stop:304 length:228 start_codon:yes stop_codon:yes gene_type:complete
MGLVSKGGVTTLVESAKKENVKAKSQKAPEVKFTASDTDFLLKLFMDSSFKGEQIDKAHSVLTKLVTLHRRNVSE